jgi:hypothetical protein
MGYTITKAARADYFDPMTIAVRPGSGITILRQLRWPASAAYSNRCAKNRTQSEAADMMRRTASELSHQKETPTDEPPSAPQTAEAGPVAATPQVAA